MSRPLEHGIIDATSAARIGVEAGTEVVFLRYDDDRSLARFVWRRSTGEFIAGIVDVAYFEDVGPLDGEAKC